MDQETIRRTKDGRVIEVIETILPVRPENDKVTWVVHIVRDPAELRRKKALEVLSNQPQIALTLAHELRNPLANLVLCNEIMWAAVDENNIRGTKSILERNKNNIMRLNKMIAELYDSTSIHAGNLRLEITQFNFEDMIKEAIETIEILQPSYNIILKGSGNIQVSADRHRLIQVVTNYLSNGIKYSNGKTDVTLTIEHDECSVTVSVKDEGLGISKEQLPYIFQRFFRAEKTKNLEGIGLGLYLCQQIIVAHGGNVWVESEEGKGSTFYFSVPTAVKFGGVA
jgi:signal transduction histidine kinase